MMPRVDAKKGNPEINPADPILDIIGNLGVKNLAPKADHGLRIARGDRDVSKTALTGDEAFGAEFGLGRLQRGLGEELNRLKLGTNEAP